MPSTFWARKQAGYLLVSQDGAVTMFHQDFSATSVFYFVAKGSKTFYLVRPSANNQLFFDNFMSQSEEGYFFGSHPGLDEGGCQKVTVTQGEALFMPANMIHMVATTGLSIALGTNFLHEDHLHQACAAYEMEREEDFPEDSCYPSIPAVVIAYILTHREKALGSSIDARQVSAIRNLWLAVMEHSPRPELDRYIAAANRELPSLQAASLLPVSDFYQIQLVTPIVVIFIDSRSDFY